MTKYLVILTLIVLLLNCNQKTKNTEIISDKQEIIDTLQGIVEIKKESNNKNETIHIYLLDSLIDVNYYKYIDYKGFECTSGVNIIDKKTNSWIFDSEGPQIESYSDIRKIDDSYYIVSVYYNVLFSKDTIPKKIQIMKYDLKIDNLYKKYTFYKDSTFYPNTKPFTQNDISNTLYEYNEMFKTQYSDTINYNSAKSGQNILNKMFKIQLKLLSSYISGCDSCKICSFNLFNKFSGKLLASDSDYEYELVDVFNSINNKK